MKRLYFCICFCQLPWFPLVTATYSSRQTIANLIVLETQIGQNFAGILGSDSEVHFCGHLFLYLSDIDHQLAEQTCPQKIQSINIFLEQGWFLSSYIFTFYCRLLCFKIVKPGSVYQIATTVFVFSEHSMMRQSNLSLKAVCDISHGRQRWLVYFATNCLLKSGHGCYKDPRTAVSFGAHQTFSEHLSFRKLYNLPPHITSVNEIEHDTYYSQDLLKFGEKVVRTEQGKFYVLVVWKNDVTKSLP